MNRISGCLCSARDMRSIGRRCFVVAGQQDRKTGRHHVLFVDTDSDAVVELGACDYPPDSGPLCFDFSEDGLAPVRIDGKWGFIDSNGSFVIPPRFDSVSGFNKGRAWAAVDSKYGLID